MPVVGRSVDFIPRLGRRSIDGPVGSFDINNKLFEQLEHSKQYASKRKPIYYTIPRLGKRFSIYPTDLDHIEY